MITLIVTFKNNNPGGGEVEGVRGASLDVTGGESSPLSTGLTRPGKPVGVGRNVTLSSSS